MNADNWLADIYSKERDNLFLTAWNILKHAEASEDAVHEAFARMAKLPTSPRAPRLYAFKAVRNAAIDTVRANAKQPHIETITQTIEAGKPRQPLNEFLEAGLESLSPEVREIVELHIHSGLTFREVAELTQTPLQTVASRYRRALDRIRETVGVKENE